MFIIGLMVFVIGLDIQRLDFDVMRQAARRVADTLSAMRMLRQASRAVATQLTSLPARAAAADDALLHVGLQHAERLLVPLDRHVQGLQHPLGREVVGDDPLLHFDRLGRHAEGLGVEAEVEDQLLGRAGDAAEIGVQAHGVLVVHFDALARCMLFLSGLSWLDRRPSAPVFSFSATIRFPFR